MITTLGAMLAGLAGLAKLVSLNPRSFPPCNAQPIRGSRGLLGSKIILVHCTQDGEFTLKPIDDDLG